MEYSFITIPTRSTMTWTGRLFRFMAYQPFLVILCQILLIYMIFKWNVCWFNYSLNEPEFIYLHTVKCFQVLLFIVCMHLNGLNYSYLLFVWVDLGVIVKKGYSKFPKASGLEPLHLMV